MAKRNPKRNPSRVLRELALRHADTEVGIACEGTSLERATVKVKKKAFVFIGVADAMLKLDASLAEARQLAKAEPARFKVGKNGWVTANIDAPFELLERWIAESYALAAGVKKKRG